MSNPDTPLVHQFTKGQPQGLKPAKFAVILGIAIVLGIGIGFGASIIASPDAQTSTANSSDEAVEGAPKTAGVKDNKVFPDKAEGTLKEGGIEGEGSFHLVRPGGESQNVYMTSSTIDLSLYIDKKVRVHGATQKAEKAGWLMDVGYLEVL